MEKDKRRERIIFAVLIALVIIINYPFLDGFLKKTFNDYEIANVTKVIDGDTLKIGNESVRLLGINCPEKGEKFSSDATEFLAEKTLGKTVEIRYGKTKYDKYHRKLGYVFIDGENVNLELVENGLANTYFPSGKNEYYPQFISAWRECIENGINLCKYSDDKCAKCIDLANWEITEQIVVLENNCNFSCNLNEWSVKDEGRKKFIFGNITLKSGESLSLTPKDFGKEYVWTKTGDTIYIRDSNSLLVLWETY
ncbi:hypothetical protein B6U91_00300 [Candidatus Pacearchaeota archaeon ex4484_71]|nr:MAG: hypothetical protein B6U91_00300 [Candidatus Pacearchaeota archaeon ex4484_71]